MLISGLFWVSNPPVIRLLPDLSATRMLTTLAITSARAAAFPENAAYILRNFADARDGLCALAALDRTTVKTNLQTALNQRLP